MADRPPATPAALHALEFRLSWGECDPAGIIYYATYLEWAERVHSEWWHLRGHPIDALAATLGAAFVVRHVSCDYLRSPTVGTMLRGTMACSAIGTTSFTNAFAFSAVESGDELCRLDLTAVFVDGDRRSTPVPAAARHLLLGSR